MVERSETLLCQNPDPILAKIVPWVYKTCVVVPLAMACQKGVMVEHQRGMTTSIAASISQSFLLQYRLG